MEQKGTVIRKTVATGSKSERAAVMLETPEGEYVLRIQGGNPFQDARLDGLVGKRIVARGRLHGNTFLMNDWTED